MRGQPEPRKPSLQEALQERDVARARQAALQLTQHRKRLSPNQRTQMASNLGVILEQAKAGGAKPADIIDRSGISSGSAKRVNDLANYRIRPGGRRTAAPRLSAEAPRYLAIAKAAASLGGIPEEEAILALVDGIAPFDARIDPSRSLAPAEQVYLLLMERLQQLEARYDLPAYFREQHALRALPRSEAPLGWEVDLGRYEPFETDAWPSVLLTAVVRSKAEAVIQVGEDRFEGHAMFVEQVRLTLGWHHQTQSVRHYFDLLASKAVEQKFVPTLDEFLRFRGDSPWIRSGYPPATGGAWVGKNVCYVLKPGERLTVPESSAKASNDPYDWSRLLRLDPATLAEIFLNNELLTLNGQHLPYAADESSVLSPPGTALARLEAVLLDRPNETSAQHDFMAELEKDVRQLVESFWAWRNDGIARAREDHQRLLGKAPSPDVGDGQSLESPRREAAAEPAIHAAPQNVAQAAGNDH